MMRFAFALALLFGTNSYAELFAGRVVESVSRKPLATAQVRIRKAGAVMLLADLDTDSAGQFHGPDLAPGSYTVEATKPNYLSVTLRLEIAAASPAPLTIPLIHYGVVSGKVLDQQGQPVQGARILALPMRPDGTLDGQAGRPGDIQGASGDNGQYRLYRLTPGRYALAVAHDSMANVGSNFLFAMENSRPRVFQITSGEEYRDINFTLLTSNLVRVEGTIQTGKPGSYGVAIIARDHPEVSVSQMLAAKDGKFHFDGIPAGSYDLVAAGPTNSYGYRNVVVEPGALFGRISFDITGARIDPLTVPLAEGRAAALLLHAAKGCPETVAVRLVPLEDLGVFSRAEVDLHLNQTAKITDLAPGKYRAEVIVQGNPCYQAAPVTLDVRGASITEPIALTIDVPGSITGRLDAPNPGETSISLTPIPGNASPVLVVYPDSDGRFAFSELRPGRYRIMAKGNVTEWDVAAGASTQVELK